MPSFDGKSSDLASLLDEHWGDWRNGNPNTDFYIYREPITSQVHMVKSAAADPDEGWLNIDGKLYYSAAWLPREETEDEKLVRHGC
jgi:hypothetical protein